MDVEGAEFPFPGACKARDDLAEDVKNLLIHRKLSIRNILRGH